MSVIRCDHLVVATGKSSSPRRPVAVLNTLKGFSGEVRSGRAGQILFLLCVGARLFKSVICAPACIDVSCVKGLE